VGALLAIPSILIALVLYFSSSRDSRKTEQRLADVVRGSEQRQIAEIHRLGDLLRLSPDSIDSLRAVDETDKKSIQNAQDLLKTDPARVTQLLNTLSDKYRDLAAVPFFRGGLAFNLAKYDEALRHYDVALYLNRRFPAAWSNRGNALYRLGRFEEALASYDSCLAYQPDLATPWSNRGVTLDRLGRFEEALASYDSAIALQPDSAKPWYNRGVTLNRLGRYGEALANYDSCLVRQHDSTDAWFNRGNSLNNLGRYVEAVASYDSSLIHQSRLAEAWSNRAVALANLGQYTLALASIDSALAILPPSSPETAEVLRLRNQLREDLGDSRR
jgi:tetratricopeptide (TPR) repeat protein